MIAVDRSLTAIAISQSTMVFPSIEGVECSPTLMPLSTQPSIVFSSIRTVLKERSIASPPPLTNLFPFRSHQSLECFIVL